MSLWEEALHDDRETDDKKYFRLHGSSTAAFKRWLSLNLPAVHSRPGPLIGCFSRDGDQCAIG